MILWATLAWSALAMASPNGGPLGDFDAPRRLSTLGYPGDVAIRGDGSFFAVWTTANGLRASIGHGTERVAEGRTQDVRASYRRGTPRVEWRGGVATRR